MSWFIRKSEPNYEQPINNPVPVQVPEKNNNFQGIKSPSSLPFPSQLNKNFVTPPQQLNKNLQPPVNQIQKAEIKPVTQPNLQTMSDDFLFDINPPVKSNQQTHTNQIPHSNPQNIKPKLFDDDFLSF